MSELADNNGNMVNPTGEDKVAIFDIDHCLYVSRELKSYEPKFKKKEFIQISLEKENESNKKIEHLIDENMKNEKTFMELFCSQLNMTPFEYYSKYDVFDYGKFIKQDKGLVNLIASLRQKCRLFAMTNGSDVRAREVLNILGLSSYFEKVFCAIIIGRGHEPVPLKSASIDSPESEMWSSCDVELNKNASSLIIKPDLRAYEAVHRFIGAKSPKDVTFFDDSRKNVEASREFGWNGIFVEQYKDESTENNLVSLLEKYVRQLN